jgi:hypothetical protein
MSKWEMNKRQEWIANRTEPFRRSDLMAEFQVNIVTASTDIQTYKKNGGVLFYDLNNKYYVKPKGG